jgi:hypothetical protein
MSDRMILVAKPIRCRQIRTADLRLPRRLVGMAAWLIVGSILVGIAGLWVLADSGGLSRRMPTQVLPRRAARYPFVAGVALIVTGLAVGLSRGLD